MKLLYQWTIILTIIGILWLIYIQAGSGCSKPILPNKGIPQTIIVQPRRSSVNSEDKKDEVPQVPQTPESKSRSQKRRDKRKAIRSIAKRRLSQSSDWVYYDNPAMVL